MSVYKKFKTNTVIEISNEEESEKLQLVLFSHGVNWRDSGFSLLDYEEGYDIVLRTRGNGSCFMLWNSWKATDYNEKISLEKFLKEIN